MANDDPTAGTPTESWITTHIQGVNTAKVSVADLSAADRPDLVALRVGGAEASVLLTDSLDNVTETLYDALHQCHELHVKRQERRREGG